MLNLLPSVLKVYPRDYMKASLSENCYLLVLLFLMFKVQIQIQKRWDKIINVEHFTLHFSYWVNYEILPWQLSIFKLRYHFDFLIFRFVRFFCICIWIQAGADLFEMFSYLQFYLNLVFASRLVEVERAWWV